MQVSVYKIVAALRSRSREEGANPIILPLKQGLWGHSLSDAIEYLVLSKIKVKLEETKLIDILLII